MYEFILHLLIFTGIFIILAASCDLILGYAGMYQMGHGAFYAIGAYSAALIALHWHWPFYLEFLASGLFAGIVGALFAASMVRANADYFSLATFGLAVVTFTVLMTWDSVTRGPLGITGIPGINIFGLSIVTGLKFLILTALITAATIYLLYLLVHSPFGRALKAMREDEIATLASGRNTPMMKVVAYGIGTMFAGFAGNLYAHYISFIDPTTFSINISILVLCMVVIGGMGTLKGPVIGAFLLFIIPELLRFLGLPATTGGLIRQLIYGVVLVVMQAWNPRGLMGIKLPLSFTKIRPGHKEIA
ncbi:MAG: branched-chain amino acid ABC transporter permease [Bacillota bacterium]